MILVSLKLIVYLQAVMVLGNLCNVWCEAMRFPFTNMSGNLYDIIPEQ